MGRSRYQNTLILNFKWINGDLPIKKWIIPVIDLLENQYTNFYLTIADDDSLDKRLRDELEEDIYDRGNSSFTSEFRLSSK